MIFTHAHLYLLRQTDYKVKVTECYANIQITDDKNKGSSIEISIVDGALDALIEELMLAKSVLEQKPFRVEVAL